MLSPTQVIAKILRLEIENISHLIQRLKGQRSYPIVVKLHPPNAKQILADIAAYQKFVQQWQEFKQQQYLEYTTINYQSGIDGSSVPTNFIVRDLKQLLELCPSEYKIEIEDFILRVHLLEKTFALKENSKPALYDLYRDLNCVSLGSLAFDGLLILLPQLKANLGSGLYKRSLPLEQIDTKFVEQHDKLIFKVLQKLDLIDPDKHNLDEFLNVLPKPEGFIHLRLLRPLKPERYNYIQITASQLYATEPNCANLVISENEQSGLMLPELEDTCVIFKCGNNLAWSKALWLKNKKRIIYWGDLDSWGFAMLVSFRKNCRLNGIEVQSIMMDLATLEHGTHRDRMVREETSTDVDTSLLTAPEQAALNYLSNHPRYNRLEQEKLDADYVRHRFKELFES